VTAACGQYPASGGFGKTPVSRGLPASANSEKDRENKDRDQAYALNFNHLCFIFNYAHRYWCMFPKSEIVDALLSKSMRGFMESKK
jgi:hypothetical protein